MVSQQMGPSLYFIKRCYRALWATHRRWSQPRSKARWYKWQCTNHLEHTRSLGISNWVPRPTSRTPQDGASRFEDSRRFCGAWCCKAFIGRVLSLERICGNTHILRENHRHRNYCRQGRTPPKRFRSKPKWSTPHRLCFLSKRQQLVPWQSIVARITLWIHE